MCKDDIKYTYENIKGVSKLFINDKRTYPSKL